MTYSLILILVCQLSMRKNVNPLERNLSMCQDEEKYDIICTRFTHFFYGEGGGCTFAVV